MDNVQIKYITDSKNEIEQLLQYIDEIDNDNDMEKPDIYNLSNKFSWSSKTQHISKSNNHISVFIYETIINIISPTTNKNIIVEYNNNTVSKIKIKKKYMKDELNNKIKKYNENILDIENIRDDIIMEYFRTLYKEYNGLNEIREIKKNIETYGIDRSDLYIKIPLERNESFNDIKNKYIANKDIWEKAKPE